MCVKLLFIIILTPELTSEFFLLWNIGRLSPGKDIYGEVVALQEELELWHFLPLPELSTFVFRTKEPLLLEEYKDLSGVKV